MKPYFDIIIAYTALAFVLLLMLCAKYLSIPLDSIVVKIAERSEPSPRFMYFVLGVFIFYLLIICIRRPQ